MKKTIGTKVTTTFLGQNKKLSTKQRMGNENMCAPSYANIFIDHFERKYIYPLIEGKSLTYFRYIDDISLIWTGTKNELDQFFKDLNKNHLSIKFDYKALKGRIVFLSRQ